MPSFDIKCDVFSGYSGFFMDIDVTQCWKYLFTCKCRHTHTHILHISLLSFWPFHCATFDASAFIIGHNQQRFPMECSKIMNEIRQWLVQNRSFYLSIIRRFRPVVHAMYADGKYSVFNKNWSWLWSLEIRCFATVSLKVIRAVNILMMITCTSIDHIMFNVCDDDDVNVMWERAFYFTPKAVYLIQITILCIKVMYS